MSRTPPDLFARFDSEFRFALDAACTAANCLGPAGLAIDRGLDALAIDWAESAAFGAVWLNPPFSNPLPWVEKAREQGKMTVVACLLPVDTSTRWWSKVVGSGAAEVRFIVGRVRFLDEDGAGLGDPARGGCGLPTPCALVVFRPGVEGPPAYSYIPRHLEERLP